MTTEDDNQRKAKEALSGKKDFLRQLRVALAEKGGGTDTEAYFAGLLQVARVIVAKAIEQGEPWAAQEITNRIDGKPVQMHGADDDGKEGATRFFIVGG